MHRKLILGFSLLALLGLSACETVKGAARDVEAGAETVQSWF